MNKNVKKIFSVFLCAVMFFSLFTVTSFAEEKIPAFKLAVDGEVAVGETVRLLVSLENMPEFTQADFCFTYDSSSLECQGVVKPVKCDAELWVSGIQEEGKVTCSICNFAPIKGQVDVANVVFSVLDTSNTSVSVSVSGLDCSDIPESVEFNLQQVDTFDPSQVDFDFDYEIISSEAVITACNRESKGDIVIPDTIDGYPITTIKKGAFEGCNNITSVEIPDSVTTIEEFAFASCKELLNVTIGGGVKTLGRSIFWNCKNLEKAVILNGVTYVSEEMFS